MRIHAGSDVLDLIERLNLTKPARVGHDCGARAAASACSSQPGVGSHLVMMSVAYGTNLPSQSLSLTQVHNYWYHWFMATPRGQSEVRERGPAFAKIMWDTWSPAGWYDDQEFEATAGRDVCKRRLTRATGQACHSLQDGVFAKLRGCSKPITDHLLGLCRIL